MSDDSDNGQSNGDANGANDLRESERALDEIQVRLDAGDLEQAEFQMTAKAAHGQDVSESSLKLREIRARIEAAPNFKPLSRAEIRREVARRRNGSLDE